MATKLTNLLTALVSPVQDAQNALQQLLTLRSVDTATGAQLDVLGRLVGQQRGVLTDDLFRRYIRARISVHRSKGVTEDLITVARLIINDPAASIVVDNQGAAAVVVRWLSTIADPSVADALIAFLKPTASAGVRVILESLFALDADTFFTALTTKNSGAITIGMTRIYYDIDQADMTSWPSTGSLIIDPQDPANEEVVVYTGLVKPNLAAHPYFSVLATTKNHASHSLLILQDAPGKGCGDEASPTVGGELAHAQV